MKTIRVKCTFTDEMLATMPGNESLYSDYIASKAFEGLETDKAKKEAKKNTDEEKEILHEMNVEEELEKATTYFFKDEKGEPFIWNYMIKGFLKSACGALRKVSGTKSSKVKAFKKEIDQLFFVFPDAKKKTERGIKIHDYGEIKMLERSLRASTPQGERVALARSETVPAGSWIEFDIVMLRDEDEDWLMEMLDYGEFMGLGQWRSGSKGSFVYEIIEDKKKAAKKKAL